MKEHVLVIAHIEGDDFLALEKARDITLPMDPTLDIIQFVKPDPSSAQQTQQVEAMKAALSSNIARIFEGKSDINSDVIVSDDIPGWVAEYCERTDVDLVIKGGNRTESLFHTPCDFKLMRQLHCPILIATNAKWKTKAKNIMLAIDLSREDELHQQLNAEILHWGKKFSEVTHNPLNAVYTVPIAKSLLELEVVNKEEVLMKKGPQAKKQMLALLEKYDMTEVNSRIIAGAPDKALPHEANVLKSDIVAIGYVDHDGLGQLFAGNTAEKVLHHLRTDCLVVKLPNT